MIYETITLSEKYPEATLTTYVCENSSELKMPPRPAVIVCPGGGYRNLSEREAEPIVRKYFGASMNVYLLRYSLKEKAANSAPLIEAALAIKYVRDHAKEQNSNPDKVFIVGFSAGGHLAASSGILWNEPEVREAVGVADGSAPEGINKPNGMILGYPVITMKYSTTHGGTKDNVCGSENPPEELLNKFSLELHVKEDTPPVFLWHTATDGAVNVQNSLRFARNMWAKGKTAELHVYPEGCHGLGLAADKTDVRSWPDLAANFLLKNGFPVKI